MLMYNGDERLNKNWGISLNNVIEAKSKSWVIEVFRGVKFRNFETKYIWQSH